MQRNKAITIRVSEDERMKLNEKAECFGLTLSAYLRLSAMLADTENEARVLESKEEIL